MSNLQKRQDKLLQEILVNLLSHYAHCLLLEPPPHPTKQKPNPK